MKKLLLGIAVAILAVGGASAKGPIGTVIVPLNFDNPPFYVPCLGEYVDGYGVGEARYHEFSTPSETVHVLDQWRWTIYNVGVSSGKIWVGHAVSPFQWNARLDKGKVTLNANGELVVLHEPDEVGEIRCIGPKK